MAEEGLKKAGKSLARRGEKEYIKICFFDLE